MEPALPEVLCAKEPDPTSPPSHCSWIFWPIPEILRQRDRLTLDGYLNRRGSRRYIQDKREG